MKPLEVKFDLLSLLQDIAQLGPHNLGVDRLMIIVEKDDEKHESTSTNILLSGEDVMDAATLIFRAIKREPNVAMAVSIAAGAYASQHNNKKP